MAAKYWVLVCFQFCFYFQPNLQVSWQKVSSPNENANSIASNSSNVI